MPVVTHLGVALIPVFVFLLVLVLMDSFKLVRPGTVVVAIGMGGGVALVCLLLHGWMVLAGVPRPANRYYVAPLTEETLKAAFIVLLIARRRVGFLVDAAVQGFAVGAGFALVENIDLVALALPFLLGLTPPPPAEDATNLIQARMAHQRAARGVCGSSFARSDRP